MTSHKIIDVSAKLALAESLLSSLLILIHEKVSAKRAFYLGFNSRTILYTAFICSFLALLLLFLNRREARTAGRQTGLRFSLAQALPLLLMTAAIAYAIGVIYSFDTYNIGAARNNEFSIGIIRSTAENPLAFSDAGIANPVLTRRHATDLEAKIVADPFLICEPDSFRLFFEIWNRYTNQGDIAMASSCDGITWHYRSVVLDEPFHLVPECLQVGRKILHDPGSHFHKINTSL